MTNREQLLREIYAAFNRRDIAAIMAHLDEEVEWANGMEGGHLHGRDAVRNYWLNQWTIIDPRLTVLRIMLDDLGALVEAQQVVRALSGEIISNQRIAHRFRMHGKLITRFDIEST